MEALLLIVGELVYAILAPFVAIVVEAIAAAIGALFSLVTGKTSTTIATSRVAKIAAMILASLAGLALLAVALVNLFFFDTSMRFLFDRVQTRTGIDVECEGIDGSLLFGRVELDGCTIRRPEHETTSFDLAVAELSIDVRMTSLLGTATLDSAKVVGLDGWVRRLRGDAGDQDDEDRAERPRRGFEVVDLSVADSRVKISGVNADGNVFEMPIEMTYLDIRPLRSRLALFDVLFRSNAKGSIDGAPFSLATNEIEDGRRTEWRAEQVPIASFGAMTGGLLGWFESGTVDVIVDDEWSRGDSTTIDMDWKLDFSDIAVTPPPGTSLSKRFVTAPLTAYVNRFGGEFPLEFSLVLNEDDFEYTSSLAAAGLWSAIGKAVNNTLALVGIDLDQPESTGERLKEGTKLLLDRVRRSDDDSGSEKE